MPLFPTEENMWDDEIAPTENWAGDACLALPKINLQFLTLHDYLLRSFQLYRLESTYEIREDAVSALTRLQPRRLRELSTDFVGWSRMALPITEVVYVRSSVAALCGWFVGMCVWCH